jgi:hypothetical protein
MAGVAGLKEGEHEVDGGGADEEDDVLVFKLLSEQVIKARNLGKSDLILTVDSVPPVDVHRVADDAGNRIGVEMLAQTIDIPALLQDVQ